MFPTVASANGWFQPFGAGVRGREGSLDPGPTGPRAAFRQGRDNYELRFAVGRYVGDVKTGIVVNQHHSRKDFYRWDYEFTFGEPLSAVLPFDPEACWKAIEHRRPVVFDDRRSQLTKSIVELAQRLHGGQIELPRPAQHVACHGSGQHGSELQQAAVVLPIRSLS